MRISKLRTVGSSVVGFLCVLALLGTYTPAGAFNGMDSAKIVKMAEAGDADAQTKLGVMYSTGLGRNMDKREAVKWYRKSAEQGYPMGQWNLAFMYVRGEGVAADLVKARELFRKSAHGGLANAQYDLGVMLLNGLGGTQDRKEAEKWFRKSAEQGYREAKTILKELDSK